MATVTETLLTAEEFGQRPDPGYPEELVRGRIIRMPTPKRRHGKDCNRVGRILGDFAEENDLGHVLNNDAGVITEHGPDTVRGADVAYYSYARLPKGPVPDSYGPEIPELIVEVRSSGNSWRALYEKVAEYMKAGVIVVVVLDPERQTAHVFSDDENPPRVLGPDDELTLPELLPGFATRVHRFFG